MSEGGLNAPVPGALKSEGPVLFTRTRADLCTEHGTLALVSLELLRECTFDPLFQTISALSLCTRDSWFRYGTETFMDELGKLLLTLYWSWNRRLV